ncbi:hypothetical protein AAVH_22690 [Aphelenchoides avenae]|nr:hypothetical protein AAVH_22690 [Aphelenchus avenae]
MLIAELFELAKSERAGALCVVLNKATANSATDPALHGVSYDWGSLNSVLCSAGHSAVVATFLEGSTTYRSRVQLTTVPAGGVSHDGILPFVTASASDGSVCYHHMGVSWVHANYDFILAELLSFLGLNNAFQLASSSSLLRSTRYFTARCEVQNFDVKAHSEWYYNFYLKNRMNVYQYLIDKRAVLDYLARWCPFPGWEKHCRVPQQNLVAYSDKIVLPGDPEVMQLIK